MTKVAPKLSLPSSIRVGYLTYAIAEMVPMRATGEDAYGLCDNCQHIISIRSDLEPVKAANTVLHEVLHACWYVADLHDEDKEERIVTTLANVLSGVWRDNPMLVSWINERLDA